MDNRTVIEQAKGFLTARHPTDPDTAFRRIRAHARHHHLRLTDLCRDIVDGTVTLPRPRAPQPRDGVRAATPRAVIRQSPLPGADTEADTSRICVPTPGAKWAASKARSVGGSRVPNPRSRSGCPASQTLTPGGRPRARNGPHPAPRRPPESASTPSASAHVSRHVVVGASQPPGPLHARAG
ncbi:ANTAR domain-containing protein [Streptomyces sp. Ac-502]|uniref:ANTAR domain-containing protein n=1 Tax=Streptomyces sp. Ac-502 TaxID=3342801 RepID=UPI0038624A10